MNVLEIDSVSLSFDQRKILADVYLKCETGTIVGLIGRNGSGKSSLMKIIFGTLRGENQSVRLNGSYVKCLFKIPGAIHYLPQPGFSMNYLTFNDLVKTFRLEADIVHRLAIEEVRNNANEKLGNLSGGVKKLMEIITVLYTKGSFVMLDEPFSYLSPVLVEKLVPHLRHQSQFKGIIITDHQYETVLSVCHHCYILTNGTLNQIEDRSELAAYGYLTA